MTEQAEKVKLYLLKYVELSDMGSVGRFLSPIKDEYYATKSEHESIMDWCVRRALEELK